MHVKVSSDFTYLLLDSFAFLVRKIIEYNFQ